MMKRKDLAALLHRAAAALETPGDLTATDTDALIADLCTAGALASMVSKPLLFSDTPEPLWRITGERAREFSTPHSDGRYLCVVHMLRELSDDEEFIEGKTGEAMGEALAKQLAVELQAGYDDAGIAGHFQVMSVTLPPDEDSEFVYEQKARAAGWSKLHPTIPNPEGYVMHPDRYHPAGNVVAYLTWKECCESEGIT